MGRRRKKNQLPRPEKARGWLDTLTDPRTIRAAAPPEVPGDFRITGASEGFELQGEEAAGDGRPALKKFSMTAYTGVPMRLAGFPFPVVVDLSGMSAPRGSGPILKGHDPDAIVGHWTKAEVMARQIKLAGVISNYGDAADEVRSRASEGFPWQASIGASAQRMEYVDSGEDVYVNGRKWQGPLYVARQTMLGEVSFVPIGADGATSAVVAARPTQGDGTVNFEQWLKAAGIDPATLSAAGRLLLQGAYDAEVKAKSAPPVVPPVVPPVASPPITAAGNPANPPAPPLDFAAEYQRQIEAGRRAAADEVLRVTQITARCRKHGVTDVEIEGADGKKVTVNLEAHAIREGWTADQAELHALRAARPTVPGGLVFATNKPEVSDAVLEAAILHAARHEFKLDDDDFYFDTLEGGQRVRRVPERMQREAQGELKARYTDQVQQAAHTHFRGRITPHQVFALCLRAAGHGRDFDMKSESGIKTMLATWDHVDKQQMLRAEGASTMSISNVLANVLNKFALMGYLFVEQAYREFCAIRSVNDFKPAKSINLLGSTMFKKFGPTGELENFSLGDQAFANQAQPYGGILTIPWTHLVNDDLGILTGVPRKVGQGAGLALNDVIWALVKAMLAGTINGDDGLAFFRTTSLTTDAAAQAGTAYKPNKLTGGGSALSSAALTAAKALFDNQIDPNGNPLGFDGTTPVLIHGPTNWRAATELASYPQLVYGGGAAALQPQGNVWAGRFKPVMSRYMENANYVNSATAWLLAFDPMALAFLEIAFLNGVDTPTVLQAGPDYQFDRLGISIRGTMPFGVTQQNFRAATYAVGA
jgi:hypothetical protein